jgi:hypothetical protein
MTVTYALTVFNKARFLPAVLDAVLAERAETGGEVIALDDASTDGSAALLAAAESRGLRVLRFASNRGVMAATDALIQAAAFSFLRLVDADDVPVAGSTAKLAAAIEGSGAVLAYGTPADAPLATGAPRRRPRPVKQLLQRQPFNPSQTLIATAAAKALLPLPVEIRTAQDFWLALRLALRGDFLCCPFPVAAIAADPAGLSRSPARVFADTCRLTARALPDLTAAEARFALGRNAGRARLFFRRERPDVLKPADRVRLALWSAAPALCRDIPAALETLASLYDGARTR